MAGIYLEVSMLLPEDGVNDRHIRCLWGTVRMLTYPHTTLFSPHSPNACRLLTGGRRRCTVAGVTRRLLVL